MPEGLRVIGIGKTYFKYPFGIKSVSDFVALKDFFLEVEKNELLAILGHNGKIQF
jgi:ABC-type multidrug transport system ATPase subunit